MASTNTPYGPVDSDVSPALLPLAAQQAVNVSTAVTNSVVITSGTVFPTAPADGNIFIYTADAVNRIRWAFVYNSSGTTYKWEFIGGPPLSSEVATRESTASGSYTALATAGPSVVLPFAGDYTIAVECGADNNTNGGASMMSFDIGGTGAVDADMASLAIGTGANTGSGAGVNVRRTKTKTGLTAVTLTAKYRAGGASTAGFQNRRIDVLPIRVTG